MRLVVRRDGKLPQPAPVANFTWSSRPDDQGKGAVGVGRAVGGGGGGREGGGGGGGGEGLALFYRTTYGEKC